MTKIFIPNKAGHDFTPAERYGKLIYISKGFQDKHATNTMQRQWYEELKHSQPTDIIMMAGLSNMQAIGCAMFGHMHGRVNILIFDPDTKYKYTLRQNVFEEEEEDESPTSEG